MIRYYAKWVNDYPIVSLEDGLSENDWEGWALLTKELAARFSWWPTTSSSPTSRSSQGHREGNCQLDLDQAEPDWTVSETLDAIDLGRRNGYTSVISHRSGETEDTFIATLRWRRARDRSRRDRPRGRTGLPSTTSCCGLKKSWAARRGFWE